MKNIIIILLLLVSFAGAWEKTWDFVRGEGFRDLVQLDDGGFILVGRSGWPTSAHDEIFMMRIDADGDTIWTRIYGGDRWDYANSIVAIDDTTFAVVGVMQSAFPDGYSYLYLSRINLYGDTLWTMVNDTIFWGTAVDIAEDGSIIVLDGARPIFAKYTTDGIGFWARRFYPYPYSFITFLYDMKVTHSEPHGYITAGDGSDAGDYDAVLALFDTNGDTIWVRRFGNSEEDHFYSVIEISNPAPGYPEGFLAVGYTQNCDSKMCCGSWFVVRTNLSGDTLWTKYYSHPNYGLAQQYAKDVVWTGNESYQTKFAIVGVTSYPESLGGKFPTWLVVISDTLRGDTLWTKTYDTYYEQIATSIVLCDDGGFAIAGSAEDTLLLPYPHQEDLWLIRVDSLGNNIPYGLVECAKIPNILSLSVFPNPFNSAVRIVVEQTFLSVQNGQTGMSDLPVTVEIFDINGRMVDEISANSVGSRRVSTAGDAGVAPATREYIWQPDKSLGSGVFFVRVSSSDKSITKRIVYLK